MGNPYKCNTRSLTSGLFQFQKWGKGRSWRFVPPPLPLQLEFPRPPYHHISISIIPPTPAFRINFQQLTFRFPNPTFRSPTFRLPTLFLDLPSPLFDLLAMLLKCTQLFCIKKVYFWFSGPPPHLKLQQASQALHLDSNTNLGSQPKLVD